MTDLSNTCLTHFQHVWPTYCMHCQMCCLCDPLWLFRLGRTGSHEFLLMPCTYQGDNVYTATLPFQQGRLHFFKSHNRRQDITKEFSFKGTASKNRTQCRNSWLPLQNKTTKCQKLFRRNLAEVWFNLCFSIHKLNHISNGWRNN